MYSTFGGGATCIRQNLKTQQVSLGLKQVNMQTHKKIKESARSWFWWWVYFFRSFFSLSITCNFKSLILDHRKACLQGKQAVRSGCVTLAAPPCVKPRCFGISTGWCFICQQYTRATYSSCLFSPLMSRPCLECTAAYPPVPTSPM